MRSLIILLFFLAACQNNQPQSTEEPSPQPTNNEVAPLSDNGEPSFSELPLLATYINQIGIDKEEFGSGENISFALDGDKLILKNADELDFDLNSDKQIILAESWSGTGGEGTNECIYQLLNNTKNPTILAIQVAYDSYRNSSIMREDAYELAEELEADYPNLEISFDEVAWSMVAREEELSFGYKQPLGYNSYAVDIYILEKQGNQWVDITDKAFPKDFAQQLDQYSPIFELGEENTSSSSFSIRALTQQSIDANKAIFAPWNATISTDGDQLSIGGDKNPPVLLAWDGQQYQYKKMPNQVFELNYHACHKIDFKSDKTYTFKGNISGEEVQMEVKFQIINDGETPTVKMTGDYFYLKNKSKMPIEGTFSTNIEESISFSRLKKGKARESFDGWFNSCELKGWWQHLERLNIHEFNLKLAN